MDVTFTARHTEAPMRIRDRAEARLQRLARLEPRATAADVIFQEDHGDCRVEVRLRGPGHTIVAHGSAASFRTSLDQAVDRLSRQLRRRLEQQRPRRGERFVESAPLE